MKVNFKNNDNKKEWVIQTGDLLILKDITQCNAELRHMLYIYDSTGEKDEPYLIDIDGMDVVYPFGEYIAPWDYEDNFSMITAVLSELDFDIVNVIPKENLELIVNN